MGDYLYETDFVLVGFVANDNGGERHIIGAKAKDLAAKVDSHLKVKSFIEDALETSELMPVKSALYIKEEDYQKLGLADTGILSDQMYVEPSPFSLSFDKVINPDWEKISAVRAKSVSLCLEFFLLMEKPLKLHYKKQITREGVSMTYDALERVKILEAGK